MNTVYVIGEIGVQVGPHNDRYAFKYKIRQEYARSKNLKFKLTLDLNWDISLRQLLSGFQSKSTSQFHLKFDYATKKLYAVFNPHGIYRYHPMRFKIIQQFFEIDNTQRIGKRSASDFNLLYFSSASHESDSEESDDEDLVAGPSTASWWGHQDQSENEEDDDTNISTLYNLIREAHKSSDKINPNISKIIKCTDLRPTLRSYQNEAVRWMLDRETETNDFVLDYKPIKCYLFPSTTFWYNSATCHLTDHLPIHKFQIPSGGILADEMGLGKTVEMLAVILTNCRSDQELITNYADDNDVPMINKSPKDDNNKNEFKEDKCSTSDIIRCFCTSGLRKDLIKCTNCFSMQHKSCVTKVSSKHIENISLYKCPDCYQFVKPIKSRATFIVSPPSIKMQWYAELKKHIANENYKILIYDGIRDMGWISPIDLANYDIVLTDYNILKSETWYASNSDDFKVRLRSHSRAIQPVSPIQFVDWWRVCLDEAQMVETVNNQCSKMVKMLPTTHRWAITGTPIEKKIDNLYGLLFFLDCQPYNNSEMWKSLVRNFHNGDLNPLANFLKSIMWRTCKSTVADELGIPPQTEIVHNVLMSDLQAFFYNTQHTQCSVAFELDAVKQMKRHNKQDTIAKMSMSTLKSLMKPLRKLRQDCTVPTLFKENQQSKTKTILTPDKLLKHLKTNNEKDCKNELRTIVSTMNGIAALHIIREEYQLAERMYRQVLRWAKDYTGAVCVDSLLQMHALHNLSETMQLQGLHNYDDKEQNKKEYERLEWKYIENCSNLVNAAKDKQLAFDNLIINEKLKLNSKQLDWYTFIDDFSENSIEERNLLKKINDELKCNYSTSAYKKLSSVREICDFITTWLNKINVERVNLQEWFSKVKFFIDNLKRREHINDSQIINQIDQLIRTAFLCHLNLENSSTKPASKRQKLTPKTCLLCEIKENLKKYECTVFDKTYVDGDNKENVGTWNPSFQEAILKIVYSFGKKECIDEKILKDGEIHIIIIEALKNEFKEYSQYWAEVNYAVSAYDELNMCKSRLQGITPAELKNVPELKAKQFINIYMVNYHMKESNQTLKVAKIKFARLQGTQKYFKHLEKESEIEPCPICQEMPENKYTVLECGHHMCIICFIQMKDFYKTFIQCSICRNKQALENIYYVNQPNSDDNDDEIQFNGDYSKKIEKIVRTILQLRQTDSNVKIVVFSDWDITLKVIGYALKENGIEFRHKSTKFDKSIKEFKDSESGVTCLLLPLAYGSKGLNLIEATHVMLVEPILNLDEELQAIGRIHRIGQTRPTFVHRFIVMNTIEENIWNTLSMDLSGKWKNKNVTVENLKELFRIHWTTIDENKNDVNKSSVTTVTKQAMANN